MWKPLGLGIICVTCIGISYINTNGTCKQHEQQISSLQQKMGFIEELLIAKEQPVEKVRTMRVTGYTPTGNKTALGDNLIVGKTAAVSRNCMELLGEYVYIEGLGVRYIHDLTAKWVGDEFNICTVDVAVPTEKDAYKIGNSNRTVVHITK
jgi:3D (Asp-Asp-Asp) domain-containing protein